jgi:YidC/Oxa1 family membrane protein insertase
MLVTANIFQPLIDVFAHVIKFFHDSLGVGWGWSIVLLTVCVRLVLVPLAIKQYHSMRALQAHQPELKAIQRKYKDDKQRQQEEMMKFYRENGINPFASCLPMLAQFPVFISLFYMLRKNLRDYICPTVQKTYQHHYALKNHISFHAAAGQSIQCGAHARGAGFLFIHDITNTASGITLVVLVILYVGTQIASTLLMSAPTMVVFILRFPAGLIVYWITTNAWTMLQQYTIKRMMGPVPVAAGAESTEVTVGAGSSRRGGGGGAGGADDDEDSGGGGLGALLRGRGPRGGGGSEPPTGGTSRTPATPPPPPRKKKKRSGRRR